MRTLGLYLWKEWRDHRAVVYGIAIAAPLLLGLATLLLPSKVIHDPLFCFIGAAGCFAMVSLSLAGDLIPGEARRETLGFLRRLPSGLGVAFVAKLTFLFSALALLTAWGYLAAAMWGGSGGPVDRRLLPAAGVVLWLFAVSSWLPRGALALPASVVVLALLALPLWLLYDPSIGLSPLPQEVAAYMALAALIALPVAWLSFVRGYRFGRGPLSAALHGLVAALVLASPLWAHAGYRSHEWRSFDFESEACLIGGGVVGEGGRFLFLNTQMSGANRPMRAIRLDIETGAWQEVGGLGDTFEVWPNETLKTALLREAGSEQYDERSLGRIKWWCHTFDGATGERLRSGWSNLSISAGGQRYRAGLGWWTHDEIHDPFRDRSYKRSDLDRAWTYFARPGRWLAWNVRKLELYDPDTRERAPASGLNAHVWPQLVSDGRILVCDLKLDEVVLVDPENGAREVIHRPAASLVEVSSAAGLYGLRRGERYVFARVGTRVDVVDDSTWWNCTTLATLPDGSVVCILDYRRIVRVGADGVVTLWPAQRR